MQAKGYPDSNTRLLIRKIWDQLHIPILCLVDADPHGIEIMCTYRFGSKVCIASQRKDPFLLGGIEALKFIFANL